MTDLRIVHTLAFDLANIRRTWYAKCAECKALVQYDDEHSADSDGDARVHALWHASLGGGLNPALPPTIHAQNDKYIVIQIVEREGRFNAQVLA